MDKLEQQSRKLRAKMFVHRFLLLILLFSALIFLSVSVAYQVQNHYNISSLQESLKQRLLHKGESLISELEIGILLDRFLAEQHELHEMLETPNQQAKQAVTRLFRTLAKQMTALDQIRLLDIDGKEQVRVNYINGVLSEVDDAALQDKSDRYYFIKAIKLAAGSIFVSSFDLNIENNQLERPFKPVVRISVPIHNDAGVAVGVAVINFRADQMIDRYLSTGDQIGHDYIIDKEGYFFYSEHEQERWGNILKERSKSTLQNIDADAWKIIGSHAQGEFVNAQGLYIYRAIRFDDAKLNIVTDSSLKMVTLVDHETLQKQAAISITMFIVICVAMILIAWLVAWNWAKVQVSKALSFKEMNRLVVEKRKLLEKNFRIQENERKELAQALHDDMGQLLIAIQSHAGFIAMNSVSQANENIHISATIIEKTTQALLKKIRDKFQRLHPLILSNMGLAAAIEEMAREWMKRESIECEIHCSGELETVSQDLSIRLYRIIQEAFSNVVKHADASLVVIFLVASNDFIRIKFTDNGRGFLLSEKADGLGLIGIREFVESMNGEVNLITKPGEGLSIDITIPRGGVM
ncbi:MAG: ATP-binding protein [Gammaproteobacteria bacterium]|nr:ATP-binding protein [Gammaproteobacteria bacterium]